MHTVWNRFVSLLLTLALLLTCAPWAYAAEREDAPVPAEEEPVLEELSPEEPAPEEPDVQPEETPEPLPEEEPVQLLADTLTTEDGFFYTVANGAVTITGYTGDATNLTIPGQIDNLPVTTIGAYAFSNCDSLTEIVIPEGVTTLHQFSFAQAKEIGPAEQ